MSTGINSPVRVTKATRDRLGRLVSAISVHGWKAVGSESTEPPTMASVMDYALVALEERLPRKGGK